MAPPADDLAPAAEPVDAEPPAPRWPTEGDFGSKSWIPYVLPFLVYMIVGSFEPSHANIGSVPPEG